MAAISSRNVHQNIPANLANNENQVLTEDQVIKAICDFLRDTEKSERLIGELDLFQESIRRVENDSTIFKEPSSRSNFVKMIFGDDIFNEEMPEVVDFCNGPQDDNFDLFAKKLFLEILQLPCEIKGMLKASEEEVEVAKLQLWASIDTRVLFKKIEKIFCAEVYESIPDKYSEFTAFEIAFITKSETSLLNLEEQFRNLVDEGTANGKISEENSRILKGFNMMEICEELVNDIVLNSWNGFQNVVQTKQNAVRIQQEMALKSAHEKV